MAAYRITCTTKAPSPNRTHHHIVGVGIGDDRGWRERLSIADVYARMRLGDQFYTESISTRRRAWVDRWQCCGIYTLHSQPDAIHDNNLDALPLCTA